VTQIAQLNVDENRTIGPSSSAAAVSIDSGARRSAVQFTVSAVGVVVDRRSKDSVDVASLNSSIIRQKVL